MKMPLNWHKTCLENQKIYLNSLLNQIERLEREKDHLATEIYYYQQQINRAEKEGKLEFDPEKYKAKICE